MTKDVDQASTLPDNAEAPDTDTPKVFDCPSYYANNVRVTLTRVDIRILFGELLQTEDPELLALKAQASVVMSHQHAKSMLDVITGLIEKNADKMGFRDIYFPRQESEAPDEQ